MEANELLAAQAEAFENDREDPELVYSPAVRSAAETMLAGMMDLIFSSADLEKARTGRAGAAQPQGLPGPDAEQAIPSPLQIQEMYQLQPRGVYERRGSRFRFEVLRSLGQMPVIYAIDQMRSRQLAALCKRPRTLNEAGLKVVLDDPDLEMKSTDQKRARELEDFLLAGFWRAAPESQFNSQDDPAMPLRHLCQQVMADSQSMDWAGVYLEPGANRKRFPVAWMGSIDAATIRQVKRKDYRPRWVRDERITHVAVHKDEVVAEYTEDYLQMMIRNPVAWDRYGVPENEVLFSLIAWLAFGLKMNGSVFTESSVPPGILGLSGQPYDSPIMETLRLKWEARAKGIDAHHKIIFWPLREGQGLQWLPLRGTNRDMEYNLFLDLLVTLVCAVKQAQPDEVGFRPWRPGNSNAIGSEASPESRLTQGEDKGFDPLVTEWFWLLTEVVQRIDPQFVVVPVGLEEAWQTTVLNEWKLRMEMGLATPNDVLLALDEKEREEEWAEMPLLNPAAMQMLMQQQVGGGEGPEEPTEPGEEAGEPPEGPEEEPGDEERPPAIPPQIALEQARNVPLRKGITGPRIVEVRVKQ